MPPYAAHPDRPDHGSHPGWRAIVELPKTTLARFFAARADMLSAAMAYFTILSLAPLLMLAVASASCTARTPHVNASSRTCR